MSGITCSRPGATIPGSSSVHISRSRTMRSSSRVDAKEAVWMPVNALIIRALLNFYLYYGDNLKVECPTGSGRMMNLFEVSKEIADRLIGTFTRDAQGRRPVYGGVEKFQTDPHWRDLILFYEYFHGDNGAGIGASHQTGWTGLVARLIQIYGHAGAGAVLAGGAKVLIGGEEGSEEL